MKTPLIFTMLLLLGTQLHGQGIGDWRETTSLGTVFDAPGNGVHLTTKHRKLEVRDLRSWYFYDGFIVGSNSVAGGTSYFLLDEASEEIAVYPLEDEWSKAIKAQGLKPRIWLREYPGNWNLVDGLVVAMIVLFPVTLLLLSMQLFLVVRAIRSPSGGYALGALVVPFLVFVLWVVSVFPGSL